MLIYIYLFLFTPTYKDIKKAMRHKSRLTMIYLSQEFLSHKKPIAMVGCNFILATKESQNSLSHGWIKEWKLKLNHGMLAIRLNIWLYLSSFFPKFVTVFERLIYFDKPNTAKCSVLSLVLISRFYNSGFIPRDRFFNGLHFCLQILLTFLPSGNAHIFLRMSKNWDGSK